MSDGIPISNIEFIPSEPPVSERDTATFALIGNPNAGKTTLFNALTGLKVKTSNYPGTTVECRRGRLHSNGRMINLLDLPGVYSLSSRSYVDSIVRNILLRSTAEERHPPRQAHEEKVDGILLVIDALHLERGLFMATQLREFDFPVIIALNRMDLAEKNGIHIDVPQLQHETGMPVVPVSARYSRGIPELARTVAQVSRTAAGSGLREVWGECAGCPFQAGYTWSCRVAASCARRPQGIRSSRTEKADRLLTHPVYGVFVFLTIMLGLFFMVFAFAEIPMEWIEGMFSRLQGLVSRRIPAGWISSLLVDGVIGGVGSIMVFLPQIAILFFLLALLEDTGYLARAAFVMDRYMKRVGLPGKAFVPFLSAHACAIPAIMATRVIENPKDRLIAILVAPLYSCSARIPVYIMIIALIFPNNPLVASLTFVGAYVIGAAAALSVAWLFRRLLLRGSAAPLLLELPDFHVPCLKTAFLGMVDRSRIFVQQAGTVILLISIGLWIITYFPRGDGATEAGYLNQGRALEESYAGRIGRFMEPVIKPLGYNWQIGIGLITSLAAREVIVPTLAVVYGVGQEGGGEEGDDPALLSALRSAQRADGTPVFNLATSLSLLVFFILAAQCLPTQAVTRRETNSWRWPVFQFAYMTALAYAAAFIVYQTVSRII